VGTPDLRRDHCAGCPRLPKAMGQTHRYSLATARTNSSGAGRRTKCTPPSQHTGHYLWPHTRSTVALGSGRCGLHSVSKSSYGSPSGGAIGLQTGDDTMGYRQMTIATYATKTPRPSTTSLPLAHSRIKSSGPFYRFSEPTRPR